jgi:hypothetical protein
MDKKSDRVLVQIVAEQGETSLIDKILSEADEDIIKVNTETSAKANNLIISYKIDKESLSFVALSNDWLYQRLRMFPPIDLKDMYRKRHK